MQVKSEQNTFKQMSIKVLLNIFIKVLLNIKYFNICTRRSFILTGSEFTVRGLQFPSN